MNPLRRKPLANTTSAEKLNTDNIECVTQKTTLQIQRAIYQLEIGNNESEERAIEDAVVPFQSHFIWVATNTRNIVAPNGGLILSPSDAVQSLFSAPQYRNKLLRNLHGLKEKYPQDIPLREIVVCLTCSAKEAFWRIFSQESNANRKSKDPNNGILNEDISEELDKNEVLKNIDVALASLPDNERTAVFLYFGEGRTISDIAVLFQGIDPLCNREAIKSCISRSKLLLKPKLQN